MYVIILGLLTFVDALNMAIVRPFSPKDYASIEQSFKSWESQFIPCGDQHQNNSFDLYLSYSQDLNQGYGKRYVSPLLNYFRKSFINGNLSWSKCFQNLFLHDCKINENEDIYNPHQYYTNSLWVNGPNEQFRIISEFFGKQDYDVWYLMEMDSHPIKAGFLDALAEEIERERPFAILGSTYKGDRWDMMMNEVQSTLKNHINGNAVYNVSHPTMKFLLEQLKNGSQYDYNRIPYDYRMSQLIYENISLLGVDIFNKNVGPYKGNSKIIGNYASTNMVSELFDDEFIVHGAHMYDEWEYRSNPIALIVSDWGSEHQLETFHELILNGKHPFSEVVYVIPSHKMPLDTDFYIKGKIQEIRIRYSARNGNSSNNPDYLDSCYHQPVTTDVFMVTNTYMKISSPVRLLIEKITKKAVISYIDVNSETCQSIDYCVLTIENVKSYIKGVNVTYMIQNMAMIYNKTIMGSLYPLKLGYCSLWIDNYNIENGRTPNNSCLPLPGPCATGYMAYIDKLGLSNQYQMSNIISRGSRDIVVPYIKPPEDERDCEADIRRRILTATSSSIIATNEKKKPFLSASMLNCINNTDNKERCDSIPYCWWRPKFDKCIQLYERPDSYEYQYYRHRSGKSENIRYLSNSAPNDSPTESSLSTSQIVGIVLGSVALCLLIPACLLGGFLIYKLLTHRPTFIGNSVQVEDVFDTFIPSIILPPLQNALPMGEMIIDHVMVDTTVVADVISVADVITVTDTVCEFPPAYSNVAPAPYYPNPLSSPYSFYPTITTDLRIP